jgi:hypothetical protein
MPDVLDDTDNDRISGFGPARLREAWPRQFVSDEQRGLAPSRRAGLGEAGLPPAGSRGVGFDPERYLKDTAPPPGYVVDRDLPDAPWAKYPRTDGIFDDLIPANPTDREFVNLARSWGVGQETPTERLGTDIGKSAVSGAVKGVVGLPGVPGSIVEAAGQGLDWATRKSGLLNPEQQAIYDERRRQRRNPLPTSQDVISAFERNVSGPLYEPQTRAGRYAQAIGEFAPGLVGGPETAASKLMPRVIAPAVGSEAAAEAAQGTGYEGAASLAGAVAGHGLVNTVRGTNARLAQGLSPEAAPSWAAPSRAAPEPPPTPVGSLAEELPVATPRENIGIRLLSPEVPHDLAPRGRASVGAAATEASPLADYSPQTVQRARELLADSGLDNPHRLEQALDEASPHHTFAELTPALEKEVSGLHAADKGVAKNLISQTYLERAKEAPQRMAAAFDRAFGPPQNTAELQRAIEAERAKTATPLWRQFTQTTVTPTPALRALLPRLDAAGALRAANKAMREEGLPVQQGFARTVTDEAGEWADQVEHMPTAAAFQYAKEHLDGLIEKSLAAPGEAKAARRYTQLKNALVDAIDRHPDPNVAGVWQAARRAWQQPTELLEAQNLGRRLLTGNIDREDVPGLTAGWSPERLDHLNIGIRNYLEDLEKSNRNPTRASNKLLDAVLQPGNQGKLRGVLGDGRAEQLIDAIRHEESMHGVPNRIIGGSPTAERQAARDRYTAEGQGAVGKGLAKVAGYVRHPVRSLAAEGIEATAKRISSKQEREMAQLRDELSRIMTTQGPERNAIARALIGADEPPPSTWARPGGIVPPQAPSAAAAASARPQPTWSGGGWRAVSPDEVARMQEAARATQARPEKVPAGLKSPSLLQFLAARGGLKPTGDLRHTLDKNPVVPGYGRLFRAGGMTEEDAMTAAVEAGYLDTEQGIRGRGNIRDLHNAIHEEAHGRKRYPIGEEKRAVAVDPDEERSHIESAVADHFDAIGAAPDDRLRNRVIELVQKERLSPDVAHERAAIEEHNAGSNNEFSAVSAPGRVSVASGQAPQSGFPAAPGQRQPAGGATRQSPHGAGKAYPEAAQPGNGPHSQAIKQASAVGLANRLGLMPRIQQMALHGKTDAEIAMAIGGQLSSTDIRLVRHHLGIGSLGDLSGGDEIPFARGGRAIARRVPGELPEAKKAAHEAVGYVDESNKRRQQNCALCTKFIWSPDEAPR